MKKGITVIALALALSVSGQAQSKPRWYSPVHIAKSFGKQYVQMLHDCTHKWDFALQCAGVFGSIAYDYATTADGIQNGRTEANPFVNAFIGKRPAAHKIALFTFVYSQVEMTGINYLYNTRDVKPAGAGWDIGISAGATAVHLAAGIHNARTLKSQCQAAKLVCK